MKIRNNFVTNSSSSSFVIHENYEEGKEYRNKLDIETIKNLIDNVLEVYREYENIICKQDAEKKFLESLPERFKDYKIFTTDQIKEITEAFHNEAWSASGVYIPDEIHNVLKRTEYDAPYKRPEKSEVKKAYKELEKFCKENNINPYDIFQKDGINQNYKDEDGWWHYYYDFEFQQALRGDFCIITGENAFPYGVIQCLESNLAYTGCYHLG